VEADRFANCRIFREESELQAGPSSFQCLSTSTHMHTHGKNVKLLFVVLWKVKTIENLKLLLKLFV
jgi:hypothetical protein